jgi:hypothetical protein
MDCDGQEREIYAGFGAGNRRLFMAVQWLDDLDFPAVRIISVRDFEKRDRHKFDDMMTGEEVWVPARPHFKKKYAEIRARIVARKQAEQENKDTAE